MLEAVCSDREDANTFKVTVCDPGYSVTYSGHDFLRSRPLRHVDIAIGPPQD